MTPFCILTDMIDRDWTFFQTNYEKLEKRKSVKGAKIDRRDERGEVKDLYCILPR